MFHLTTCPTCKTKFTLPEAAMGKRQICPHCQSPFLAGKSTPEEPEAPMKMEAAAGAAAMPLAKTMLGEMAPPIKYNCPRCKKPLEAPASEAGVKKPCPECGQRLQVPAAPAPAAPPVPALNKTMLAETQPPIKYNCPNCKKPLESPSIEGGTKKPCPFCGQRLQIPMATVLEDKPNLNKTRLATDESKPTSPIAPGTPSLTPQAAQTTAGSAQPGAMGEAPQKKNVKPLIIAGGAIGGVLFLGFFACLIVMLFTGPSKADREKYELAQKKFEEAQKELDRLKKEIQQKEELKARQAKDEADAAKKWADFEKKMADEKRLHAERQKELEQQAQIDAIRYQNDQAMKAKAEAILAEKQRELERERKEAARRADEAAARQQQFEAQLRQQREETRAALEAANQRREQQTVIISQPPPYPYYPPWHPHRYWGW